MQLRTFYPFVFTLCAIPCCAMDVEPTPPSVDQPTAEQALPRNPSSPAESSNKYCLFLKVSGDQIVPIPEGFRDFFGEKIEVAKTLNLETMTLLLPQLESETIKFVLDLLTVYQLFKKWDKVTESLQIQPFDDLIKIARTATLLNLYKFKPIVRDVIIDIFQGKGLVPHAERIVTFQKLDGLEDYFVQPLKKLLFGNFKKKLRDKNAFFGVHKKIITQIPDQQIKDFCFAGNGATFFWVTADNRLKGYDLVGNTQLFDLSTAPNRDSVADFLINDNVLLATNYAGLLCCLAQQDTRMAIVDTKTNAFKVIKTDDSIIKSVPSNKGNVLFIETKNEATYLSKRDNEDLFSETNLLAIPYEDAEHNYSEVVSACFSRNDTFLYVIYEHADTKEHALYIYSVADAQLVVRSDLSGTGRVAPAQQEDQCWILCDDEVAKIHLNFQEKKLNTLLEIPVESEEYDSLLSNNDDSYLIINNEELINVAARKTDCRYDNFITFGSNQKSVLIKEKNPQQQGFFTLFQAPVRAPEFNVELDDLFARLSLVQVSTLEYLMQIFSVNSQAPTQPLVDFIKSVPKGLRDFVQAYCFPGIKLPRILDEESDRPTKKQKREHE
jgi:hypothetical protein